MFKCSLYRYLSDLNLIVSSKFDKINKLSIEKIDTPLGPMIAMSDESGICLLEFEDRVKIKNQLLEVINKYKAVVDFNSSDLIEQLRNELENYFKGKLKNFSTPININTSCFREKVWHYLCSIPYAETITYKELAQSINHPMAYRAVANANAKNPLAIIIPCHRVVNSNGDIGGYAGGIERKVKLMQLEQGHS